MADQTSVTIDAPIEKVWAVVADITSWPSWTPTVTRVRALSGPPQLGADFEVEQPKLPTAVWEIAVWEPPNRFDWVTKSMGMVTEGSHDLTADGDHTVVTLAISQSGGLTPLVRLVFGGLIRRYMATEAQSLKARCESRQR
jgi:uncharacterized membrane protein